MLRPWTRSVPRACPTSLPSARAALPPQSCRPSRRHASTVVAASQDIAASSIAPSSLDTISHLLRLPMEYMHDTLHLPYLWIIPLSALCIRLALYRPITLSTRLALQRRLAISPLISAHKPSFRVQARQLARQDPSKSAPQHQQALMQSLTSDLKKRYNCGLGRTFLLPILQFPVFLSMSWTIRDMLGAPGGTLKSFIYTLLGYELPPADASAASTLDPAMLTEGLPWAVDLTAADPTGTLSYCVAGIMLSQTLLGMRSIPGGSSMLSRVLIVFSILIGPLMAGAPAGILYYWACSSGMALVTNAFLDWRYPLVRFAPCKRPLLRNGLGVVRRNQGKPKT